MIQSTQARCLKTVTISDWRLVMARICMTDGSTHRVLKKMGACGWLYVRVKAYVVAVVVVVVIVVVVIVVVVIVVVVIVVVVVVLVLVLVLVLVVLVIVLVVVVVVRYYLCKIRVADQSDLPPSHGLSIPHFLFWILISFHLPLWLGAGLPEDIQGDHRIVLHVLSLHVHSAFMFFTWCILALNVLENHVHMP